MKIPRIYFSTIRKPWKPVHLFEYTNYGTGHHHFLFWRWLITVDFESPLWDSNKARGGDE